MSDQNRRISPEAIQNPPGDADGDGRNGASNNVDLTEGIDPGDPLTQKGRCKRTRTRDTDDPEDPNNYRYKSYHIRRACTLFGQIPKLINDGIKRRARSATGDNRDMSFIQSDRDFETFQLIIDHLGPGIEHDIVRLKNRPKDFRKIVRKIREAADQGRNNDTAGLKRDIACMLTDDGRSVLNAVRRGVSTTSKADRGFNNDVMGKFLCPITLDWDDATVRQEIRDGKHAIVASVWPRLLYKDCECDLDDMEAGLGRNMALLRVVKYLFTGRSSAFSDTAGGKTTRAGNAALAGMSEVSPRVVAYGACALRFAISDLDSWSKFDREFSMEDFYWNVVEIFDEAGEFGRQLTAWWNYQVFGTSMENETADDKTPEQSSISRLKEQRAAKRTKIFHDSTNTTLPNQTLPPISQIANQSSNSLGPSVRPTGQQSEPYSQLPMVPLRPPGEQFRIDHTSQAVCQSSQQTVLSSAPASAQQSNYQFALQHPGSQSYSNPQSHYQDRSLSSDAVNLTDRRMPLEVDRLGARHEVNHTSYSYSSDDRLPVTGARPNSSTLGALNEAINMRAAWSH